MLGRFGAVFGSLILLNYLLWFVGVPTIATHILIFGFLLAVAAFLIFPVRQNWPLKCFVAVLLL